MSTGEPAVDAEIPPQSAAPTPALPVEEQTADPVSALPPQTAAERPSANMLPARDRRRFGLERAFIRAVATGGIIGIGVALGAILAARNVQGWIIGLVVAIVSVVLSATLWSSRQL